MNRYSRHISLDEIGYEGQMKLSEAKVLVVGAGGLGCPVLQYLAAAGIGNLGIIDFDKVEISNLHRQVLFGEQSLGLNKAIAAKSRLEDLNKSIHITAYPEKLSHQNAINLFVDYDIIVDCTDNFKSRYLINDAAIITGKVLIYGGIYKFEGQVSVFNYQNGPSYRCLFPETSSLDAPNCSEIGVLGVLPGIIGAMQANEVLKIILNIGNVLSGKVLNYDALSCRIFVLKVNKSESEIEGVLRNANEFSTPEKNARRLDYPLIAIADVMGRDHVQLVDVREKEEEPIISNKRVIKLPLGSIEQNIDELDKSKDIMLFCKSGMRAKMAIEFLDRKGFSRLFLISEGAHEVLEKLIDSDSNKQEII